MGLFNSRHRSLLHFFGPQIPIEVIVPLTHVDLARAVAATEATLEGMQKS